MGTSVVAAIIAQSQNQARVSNAVATANGSHNAFIVLLILAILELLILSKVVINHKEV